MKCEYITTYEQEASHIAYDIWPVQQGMNRPSCHLVLSFRGLCCVTGDCAVPLGRAGRRGALVALAWPSLSTCS
eukprot:932771-Pelagomonas_calceolata.AAC.10